MSKLAEKVALVTGGSRGIGAAIALRLAADGADVAISYASSQEKGDAGVRRISALGVKADQAVSTEVAKLVRDVAAHLGRLDILVNNAGVAVSSTAGDPETDS